MDKKRIIKAGFAAPLKLKFKNKICRECGKKCIIDTDDWGEWCWYCGTKQIDFN